MAPEPTILIDEIFTPKKDRNIPINYRLLKMGCTKEILYSELMLHMGKGINIDQEINRECSNQYKEIKTKEPK